jgi:hypothetical protein
MNKLVTFSARTTAVAALLSLGGTAFAVTYDSNIEFDNTYRSGSAVPEVNKGWSQGGRVEFNGTGKTGADMFVTGRATLLAKQDGSAATDDMWIQVGSSRADIKLGRFEAADLFPIVSDTLVNHAGPVYYNNALRGRGALVSTNPFHAAGTVKLGNGLSLEVGVMQSKVAGDASGVRPVLSYVAGPLNLSIGLEAGKYQGTDNNLNGVGATVGYNFGTVKVTANVASGKTNSALANNSKSAFAVTVATGGLALGLIAGTTDNVAGGQDKVQTGYVAYSMPLFDIKGASITPAISTSTAKNSALNTDVQENSFRVRLNYAF